MEIIQSLTRRASVRGYFEPTEHWMRLIRIYEQRLNMFYAEKKDLSKFYFLNYGDITSKFLAEEMVNGLAYFCGVEYNRKALDIIRFEQ
ncbi:MAG: hypothetical protein GWN76_21725 [candidate division Zixibacteria bacterium]|nr:hypothetical protein [Phycisphaerae bacterium]NIR67014.1 hypothetical protein [candidate division Zixibacteria bacterium]NIS48435.1 hypothetical protein [candidate division Zixibacteria bacterium]NIU16552.1 hypothetical protein [candidate division Zixibacteria bacterium]NIW98231.1 hypothetical protein [Phycisphaerae bacterium]